MHSVPNPSPALETLRSICMYTVEKSLMPVQIAPKFSPGQNTLKHICWYIVGRSLMFVISVKNPSIYLDTFRNICRYTMGRNIMPVNSVKNPSLGLICWLVETVACSCVEVFNFWLSVNSIYQTNHAMWPGGILKLRKYVGSHWAGIEGLENWSDRTR